MDLSSFNLKRESDINRFRICYRFFAQAINYLDFLCYVKYTEFHHQIIRLTSRYCLSPETICIPDIAFLIFLETHLLWATAEELGSTILFHRMTAIDNLINKLSHLPFRIRRNQLFVQILIT